MESPYKLLVHSVGTAGIGIVHALARATNRQHQDIARVVFQAPAVLLSGLERDLAAQLAAVLTDAGLDVSAVPDAEPFEAGDDRHEIALRIGDYGRMTDIIHEVRSLMGGTVAETIDLICASPAVLMGHLSHETAHCIRERFGAIGGIIDISVPACAAFKFISDSEGIIQHLVAIADAAARVSRPRLGSIRHWVCDALNFDVANEAWAHARKLGLAPVVVNEDFARYDVVLETATPSVALVSLLTNGFGIPESVVPRLLIRLPIVIAQDIGRAEADTAVAAVTELGGVATAQLLCPAALFGSSNSGVELKGIRTGATGRRWT